MQHLIDRYASIAREGGSDARTPRGILAWMRKHPGAMAKLYAAPSRATYRPSAEMLRVDRELRRRAAQRTAAGLRSTKTRVRMIAEMVQGINAGISNAERGCTTRTIPASSVLCDVVACAKTRQSLVTTGGGVAKSYDYAYSTSYSWVSYRCGSILIHIARDHSRNGLSRETRVMIPRRLMDGISFDGLLHGDCCTITTGGVRRRYREDGTFSGVILPMPDDLRGRFGWWEHGSTVAECRAEIQRKRDLVAAEAAERAMLAREKARMERRARLVARLCQGAIVSAADVRRVGACEAGISAWCRAHGVDPSSTLPLPTLARDASAARYALMIARNVKRRTL